MLYVLLDLAKIASCSSTKNINSVDKNIAIKKYAMPRSPTFAV